jgi:tetratricopeptide (TPR) repeat protein
MVDPATIVLDPAKVEQERRAQLEPNSPAPAARHSSNPSPRKTADPGEEYRTGIGFKQTGMYREALSKFEAAERDSGYRFKASVQRGLCLKTIGRLDDAAAAFRHALAVNGAKTSDVMHVRYVLGLTLDGMGLRDEARGQYQAIHEADPSFRDVASRVASGERLSTISPRRRSFLSVSWLRSFRETWL